MSQIEINKVRPTTVSHREFDGRPSIIPWKNIRIIRPHAITTAVTEMVKKSKNRDVLKIAIVGEPDTGKTTQADTIGHLFHKIALKEIKIDFQIRAYGREAFTNITATLAELAKNPTNYILKFGDLSFLKATFGPKKVAELEHALTQIRHLPGGKDVKIVIIYDYHYSKALPPYIRQSDYKFFTGVGEEEKKNMGDLIGPRYFAKMLRFKKLSDAAPGEEKFTYPLGAKGSHTYEYRNPMIPMLFWNQVKLRDVVSPTRHWLDPFCNKCATESEKQENALDVDRLIEVGRRTWTPGVFTTVVKLKLRSMGINTFSPTVVCGERWFDKITNVGFVNYEEIGQKMGLIETKTVLRRPIDEAVKPAEPEQGNIE